MIRFALRRLGEAAIVVFCVFTVSFVIMRASPGSPFDADKEQPPLVVATQAEVTGMAAPVPSPLTGTLLEWKVSGGAEVHRGDVIALFSAEGREVEVRADADYGVFRTVRRLGENVDEGQALLYRKTSLASQYLTTLWHYARLDFGTTFDSRGERTVMENIRETLPVSAELGLYALFIAVLFGVTSGLVAGLEQNTWVDYSVMSVAMVGISVPSIVLGPLFILVFVMHLQWLPPYGGWEPGLFADWGRKILPALTLGLGYAAYFARLTRGGMLEVVRQDWIRTARAKGLSERLIVTRHAIRGALLPVITYLGPAIASLMVGSVVVERVFNVPGISKYFIESAINRDYPMVMGVVVLYSVFLTVFNLLVDIAYAYLDPRVRYADR